MPTCDGCGGTVPVPEIALQLACQSCGETQPWSPGAARPAVARSGAVPSAPAAPAPVPRADGAGRKLVSEYDASPRADDEGRKLVSEYDASSLSLTSKLVYVFFGLAAAGCLLAACGMVVGMIASRWIEEMFAFGLVAFSYAMLALVVLCIGRYLRLLALVQEQLWKRGRALLLAAQGDGDYASLRPEVERLVAQGRVLSILGIASAGWIALLGLVACGLGIADGYEESILFGFGLSLGSMIVACFVLSLAFYCRHQVLNLLELTQDQDALLTELELRAAPAPVA